MELQHEHLTRQMDIIPLDRLNVPIHIIGCGAIGSFLGLAVAKMGMSNINLWDFDVVSIENMNNQFYPMGDINKNKAHALADLITKFTEGTRKRGPTFNPVAVTPEHCKDMKGIVVVAVDSMAARQMIFDALKDNTNVKHIVDPRMASEAYVQYVCINNNPASRNWYSKFLYEDKDAVAERCTGKSTIYTATLAAGFVAKTVKDIITGDRVQHNVAWDIRNSTQMTKSLEF